MTPTRLMASVTAWPASSSIAFDSAAIVAASASANLMKACDREGNKNEGEKDAVHDETPAPGSPRPGNQLSESAKARIRTS